MTDVAARETYQLQTKRSINYYYLLGKGDYVFGSIGLCACLWTTLLNKLWMDWDEILWKGSG